MDEIIEIPFAVSARTARLIGRENIATSKGAIIELVKNAYDADSKGAIVYFDNRFSTLQPVLSKEVYVELLERGIAEDLLNKMYIQKEEGYFINEEIQEEVLQQQLRGQLNNLNTLYIIDAGDGMTQKIIRENWMTIGTDNKAIEVFTKSGRVRAGAKGIGRFALDKLGSQCEMITIFNPQKHGVDIDINGVATNFTGYSWEVNWDDFEGQFKTIDKVKARLTGLYSTTLKEEFEKKGLRLPWTKINENLTFTSGTLLKITGLRENWDDFFVNQVYEDMEVLIPPKETAEFKVFVFNSLAPDQYGEVLGSVCDDYDYKLVAKADENQNVKITISRLEYDIALIPPEFFNRPSMQQFPYSKDDFFNKQYTIEKSFAQLLPGYMALDAEHILDKIGPFDFSFYFLKRGFNTHDANRFFYQKFMANSRRDWLDKFGGIKLFRDDFRVRPYGETKDAAFDWLGLGNRKATSPAGIAKEDGGYRVEPENVAGAVNISRLANVSFEDKSSREGLQENTAFRIFKQLLIAIINVFEEDRSFIARQMDAFDNERFFDERTRQEAEAIAKRVLAASRAKKRTSVPPNNGLTNNLNFANEADNNVSNDELAIMAELNEQKTEVIEKLKEEQKLLRGLASSGIVLASFSHELGNIGHVLHSRIDKIKKLLVDRISEEDYFSVEDRKNPFAHLEKMRAQDIKLQDWLNFAIGTARKDKRKRKQLFLRVYFNDFKAVWATALNNRGVRLDVNEMEEIDIRVFEIDFDSIFNNLVVNSIDAFIKSKVNRERHITISVLANTKEIIIEYHDNGPGLSEDIDKPEKIFEPMFTTKRNVHTGEESGTGLGMWLIKSIAEENDGTAKLLFPREGFGIRLSFPIKYKRN